jgi:pheromone shutdown-related protein TraB
MANPRRNLNRLSSLLDRKVASLKIPEEHKITIIETAQAARAIEELKPDIVAFELCRDCHESRTGQEDAEEELKIHELLKGNKILLLLVQMLIAGRCENIASNGNTKSGSEMREAIAAAKKAGARLESLYGNEAASLERSWNSMSLLNKIRLLCYSIQVKMNGRKDGNDAALQMISDLSQISPTASGALKSESDSYLGGKLLQLSRVGSVLVVVDAGHAERIKEARDNLGVGTERLENKKKPGRKISPVKILGTVLTLLVLAAMALVLVNAQSNEKMILAFVIWFAITGGLSALGVILARGHPLSALTALMVAWLTTLIPFVAAGLFAGTVEACKQKPTVGDLRRLGRMGSLDEMRQNRLFKVLLVSVMANLGGIAGMFLGIYIIWQRLGLMNPNDLIERLH